MIIYRDGQAIELTGKELQQAYEEVQNDYYIDDIGNKLREDYDIEPCTDDSEVDLAEIALIIPELLGNNDLYNDIYWDAIYTAIKQYLKEKGIK